MRKKLLLKALAAAAMMLPATAIAADANYFKGKTMTIIVPYGPGGTYDQYAQIFAEYLGRHVPGEPNVIVQHMPGAGGVNAMNWAYNVMPKDGLNMITPLDNGVVNQLMRPEKMRYDVRNFRWIGTTNQTNLVMAVRSDSGVKTWKDMVGKELIGSSSGQDTSFIGSNLANGLLGTNIRVISGYKGSKAAMFAIEQGESQLSMYNWLAWNSVSHWLEGDKPFARVVLQLGGSKDPDIPADVPLMSDLVEKDEDRKIVDFIASLGVLGRGLALPPGVPDDIVATLRTAYDKMNADPAFAADLTKRKLRLIPSKGADIQARVQAAVDGATPEIVARASEMIYGM
ncbi:MAG: tripartite tricarboxylate transporter substrate-binding protein [Rhodospirillaceae bacterium]